MNLLGSYIWHMEWVVTISFGVLLLWISYRLGHQFDFGLPRWVLPGLLMLKFLLGAVVFYLFTVYYPIRSEADIFKYFDDASVLYHYMVLEPAAIDDIMLHSKVPVEVAPRLKSWFAGGGFHLFDSSRIMVKVHILLRLFSFGSYHFHSFFFTFLSFLGCVAILKAFKRYAHVNMWAVLACLMMPSFQLWSSAPLKESVAVWFLMWVIAGLYQYLHTGDLKRFLMNCCVLVPLYAFKSFYVLLLLPCIAITLLIQKPTLFRYAFTVVIGVGLLWIADLTMGSLSPIDIMARKQLDFFDHFGDRWAGSMTTTPVLKPHILGFFELLPHAFLNAFLKPLPWESLNPLYLASAAENFLVLALIFMIFVKIRSTKQVSDQRFVMFVICFILVVFVMLGFSCPIIGSLMRFKSPILVLPPLAFLLVHPFFKSKKL